MDRLVKQIPEEVYDRLMERKNKIKVPRFQIKMAGQPFPIF